MNKILLLCLINFYFSQIGFSQITFQHQYAQPDSASSFEGFDAKATPDGGYVITGISSETSTTVYHPFILKVNCKGDKMWENVFGTTQTNGNVNPRVIVTHDSGFVMINNIGVYNNYNGLAVRLDKNGGIVWQKTLNLSNGNDLVNDVKETTTGELIITGASKGTPDVSLVKLDASGNLIWHKTFGNIGQIDEGSALIETADGGYVVTGRYISMLTFNAFLLKTDSSGAMQWLRCYGDTNQHMWGMDVKELSNGDLVMVGSSTLLKTNYQSWSDNYIMRLNNIGDTLWTKFFYGNPDLFENVSSVEVDDQGNFILGVATASYPTSGFVPNKHVIVKFSPNGFLLQAKTYNDGSSHYPRIAKALDKGYVLVGLSNAYSGPIGFQTLLMKLDENLSSGCHETDVTALTSVASIPFRITQPIPVLGTSGSIATNTASFSLSIQDSILCESYPQLIPNFTVQTSCIHSPVLVVSDTIGLTSWHWDFGVAGSSDTSNLASASYVYDSAGTYTITLLVGDGCDTASISKTITVVNPIQNLGLGADQQLCIGSSLNIGTSVVSTSYIWNTGAQSDSILVTQAGTYIVTIDNSPCGLVTDTIVVTAINCDTIPPPSASCTVHIPNAFSPNGDLNNDVLKPIVAPFQSDFKFIKFEVYNRWGNLVYTTNNPNEGWDGKYNGKDQTTDSYYYFVRYTCGSEQKVLKGDVILVR